MKKLTKTLIAAIFVLQCAAAHVSDVAGEQSAEIQPLPTMNERLRAAVIHLRAGHWQDAGEGFGTQYYAIENHTRATRPWWPAEDDDITRFQLINFYFRHVSLQAARNSYDNAAETILAKGGEYQKILPRLGKSQRSKALDFAHTDLLREILAMKERERADRLPDAWNALLDHPNSIPALYAWFMCNVPLAEENKQRVFRDFQHIMAGNITAMHFARDIADGRQWPYATDDESNMLLILDRAAQIAPSREERARFLLRVAMYRMPHYATRGDNPETHAGLARFSQVYEKYPKTFAAGEARIFAAESTTDVKGVRAGMAFCRALRDGMPIGHGVDDAFTNLGYNLFQSRKYAWTADFMEENLPKYTNTSSQSHGRLLLAKSFGKLKRHDEQIAVLRRTAGLIRGKIESDVVDRSRLNSELPIVVRELAVAYESQGKWADALKTWKEWQPSSLCGNDHESSKFTRVHHESLCLFNLDQAGEALKLAEPAMFKRNGLASCPRQIPMLVVDHYQSIGKLDELEEKIADACKRNREMSPRWRTNSDGHFVGTKVAAEYIKIVRLANARDVRGLWNYLQTTNCSVATAYFEKPNWQSQTAMRQLVELAEQSRPFLKSQLATPAPMQAWAFAALANMGDKNVIRQLVHADDQLVRFIKSPLFNSLTDDHDRLGNEGYERIDWTKQNPKVEGVDAVTLQAYLSNQPRHLVSLHLDYLAALSMCKNADADRALKSHLHQFSRVDILLYRLRPDWFVK